MADDSLNPMIPPSAAQLQLWHCHYLVKCTARRCGKLARIIIRYVEDGGARSRPSEFCDKHAKVEIEAAKSKAIVIHDLR